MDSPNFRFVSPSAVARSPAAYTFGAAGIGSLCEDRRGARLIPEQWPAYQKVSELGEQCRNVAASCACIVHV